MKSIIQHDLTRCYICGKRGQLDTHHIFGGGNRNNSERYGLTVRLCHDTCHLNGVHKDGELAARLKEQAQEIAMECYNWSIDDFIAIFGKNYIKEKENV